MISTATAPQGGEAAQRRLDGVTGTLQQKQANGGNDMLVHAGIALALTALAAGVFFLFRRLLRTKSGEDEATHKVRTRLSPTAVDTPSSETALVSTSEADAIDRKIKEWAAAESHRAAGGAETCRLERVTAGSAASLSLRTEDGGAFRVAGIVSAVDRRSATFDSEVPLSRESIEKDAALVVFDRQGGAGVHGVAPTADRSVTPGRLRLAANAPGVMLKPGIRRACEITGTATLGNGDEIPVRLVACGLDGAIGVGSAPAKTGVEIELWTSFDDGGEAEAVRCVVVEAPVAHDGEPRFAVAFRSPAPDLRARIAVRLFRAAASAVNP